MGEEKQKAHLAVPYSDERQRAANQRGPFFQMDSTGARRESKRGNQSPFKNRVFLNTAHPTTVPWSKGHPGKNSLKTTLSKTGPEVRTRKRYTAPTGKSEKAHKTM